MGLIDEYDMTGTGYGMVYYWEFWRLNRFPFSVGFTHLPSSHGKI